MTIATRHSKTRETRDQAVGVLTRLGFSKAQSSSAVDDAIEEVGDTDLESVIRAALLHPRVGKDGVVSSVIDDVDGYPTIVIQREHNSVIIKHESDSRFTRYLTIAICISFTVFFTFLSLALGVLLIPMLVRPLIDSGPLQLPAHAISFMWSNPVSGLLLLVTLPMFATTKNRAVFWRMWVRVWFVVVAASLALALALVLAIAIASLLHLGIFA